MTYAHEKSPKSVKPKFSNDETIDDDAPVLLDVGTYCMTINPSDGWQFYENKNRVDKVRSSLYDLLMDFKNVNITLYSEISEPGIKGMSINSVANRYPRVHFHGTIEFKDVKAVRFMLEHGLYKLNQYHVNICKYKIVDGKPDIKGWDTYCKKQQHIIGDKPLVLKSTSVRVKKQVLDGDLFADAMKKKTDGDHKYGYEY